jgi:hypothetical protein
MNLNASTPTMNRRNSAVILHNLLGAHVPKPSGNRWENGLFVSSCGVCGRAMMKPTGGQWQLARKT